VNVGALVVTALLLLGNAFFVGSEFALIASRRTVVEPMAATSRRARIALSAMNQIPLMIAGAQLGITICSLGLGAIAEPALAHLLEGPFRAAGLPDDLLHPVALVIALAVIVYLHTVVGEMVPKNLAIAGPERSVLWLGPPMLGFCVATKPLLLAMKWLSRHILRVWRIESQESVKTVYTAEELASLVAESRTEGLLDAEEHARITGALALSERTAGQVLRPWAQVHAVAADITPAALETLAHRTGRSRFPVITPPGRRAEPGRPAERLSSAYQFVHVKDMIGVPDAARQHPIPASVLRPMPSVAPDCTLAELLLFIRRAHCHIVLVSDGAAPLGVVTLDDVLLAVVDVPAAPETPA
jgi:CBS domain containing-hemolysin-like protein